MKFNEAMKRYQYKLKEMPYSKNEQCNFYVWMKIIKFLCSRANIVGPQSKRCRVTNVECDLKEFLLARTIDRGLINHCILLFSLLDFADINRYQICPYLIERRKFSVRYFARIMAGNENLSMGRLLTLIDGEVKWAISQINKVLDLHSIRYVLEQIYTIYNEYVTN